MIKELDQIVINKDYKEYGIEKGDVGTVVHIYKDFQGFEIEFVSGTDRTFGVYTIKGEDVRSMKQSEILHIRELHTA